MRNMYFRYKNDVQPEGMGQERTCHGFQSNHPPAIKMSVVFPHVGVLVCACVPGVSGGARQAGGGSSLCESPGKCWAPPAEGRELRSHPRAGSAQSSALLLCPTALCPLPLLPGTCGS